MVDISGLNEPARSAAERATSHGLTLTSGHRDVNSQAHAMAVNVAGNPHYLQIYASQAVRDCQAWVDQWLEEHPGEQVSVDDCSAYLLQALDGKWDEVSWHLTGDAFDCSPSGTAEQKALLEAMAAEINSSGGEAKFLDSEHGDPAWHLQCRGGSLAAETGGDSGAAPAAHHGSAHPAHHAGHEHGHHHAEHHGSHHVEHHAHAGGGPAYQGTPLQHGSTGDEVRTWQEHLASLGYHDGAADGDFGPHTEEATKAFQRDKGLTEDGIVGEHTWSAAFG